MSMLMSVIVIDDGDNISEVAWRGMTLMMIMWMV